MVSRSEGRGQIRSHLGPSGSAERNLLSGLQRNESACRRAKLTHDDSVITDVPRRR
jgi:hypothetical protein